MKKATFPLGAALGLTLLAACSEGLEPVSFQGVSGNVTYLTEPQPAATDWIRLAVYQQLPNTELDLLSFVAFSDTLLSQGPTAPFAVPLEAGDYAWLVVVWKEKGNENLLTALRAAGWYTGGGGPFDVPASFSVAAGEDTDGANVIADFANMLTISQVLEILP